MKYKQHNHAKKQQNIRQNDKNQSFKVQCNIVEIVGETGK